MGWEFANRPKIHSASRNAFSRCNDKNIHVRGRNSPRRFFYPQALELSTEFRFCTIGFRLTVGDIEDAEIKGYISCAPSVLVYCKKAWLKE
jgi:hypothetical protein